MTSVALKAAGAVRRPAAVPVLTVLAIAVGLMGLAGLALGASR